jgi:hypothetical protein
MKNAYRYGLLYDGIGCRKARWRMGVCNTPLHVMLAGFRNLLVFFDRIEFIMAGLKPTPTIKRAKIV